MPKLIDNAKLWKDSWCALVTTQLQVVTEYEGLYDPIVGASDGRTQSAPTPQLQLERTYRLKTAYSELKTELMEEISLIDGSVMRPASDARDAIAPIRKTIKKREDKRLAYEKSQERTLKLQRKPCRTVKEDAALAKAEAEMSRAADVRTTQSPRGRPIKINLRKLTRVQEFSVADDHLRATLPRIIDAAFSLVNPLLANLVMIQNRLLGLYYTTLHGYCEEFGFPSPSPPMEEVVAIWNASFGPARSEVESISSIARGKAVQQPMNVGLDGAPPKPSPAPASVLRRTSSGLISGPQARTLRVPSSTSLKPPSPAPEEARPSPSWKRPDYANATDFTTATVLGGSAVDRSRGPSPGASVASGQRDYFSQRNPPSPALSAKGYGLAKKKPPPPPPPKRIPSTKPDEWVVAEFAFLGQGQGDLSFQQGDRIKVVKRTGTDQDWYVIPRSERRRQINALI